jgi:hypothetical protein
MGAPTAVQIRSVPAASRSARDRLIDAMDMADLLGHEIPCKTEPEEFTSDLLAFNSPPARMLAAELAVKCRGCPVVAECGDHVRAARKSRAAQMYGVVAGYLVLPHTTHQINPQGDA